MKVITDKRVKDFLASLSEIDQGRAQGYIELFEENGFRLPSQYLKKLESNLWELRPGSLRLLLGKGGEVMVIVNAFKKKSQKTPKQEIKTAKRRLRSINYEKTKVLHNRRA